MNLPAKLPTWRRLIVTGVIIPWVSKLVVQAVLSPQTAVRTLIFFPVELLYTSRVLWVLSAWNLPAFLVAGVAARTLARRGGPAKAASAAAGAWGLYLAVLTLSSITHLYLWQDLLRQSTGPNPFNLLAYLPLYCLAAMPPGYWLAARLSSRPV